MTASTNNANQEQFCENILSTSSAASPSNSKSIPNGLNIDSNNGFNFGKVMIIGLGQIGLPVVLAKALMFMVMIYAPKQ